MHIDHKPTLYLALTAHVVVSKLFFLSNIVTYLVIFLTSLCFMLLTWNLYILVLELVKTLGISHIYFVDSNFMAYLWMFPVLFGNGNVLLHSNIIKIISQIMLTVALNWFWHNYLSLHSPAFVLDKFLCAHAWINLNVSW